MIALWVGLNLPYQIRLTDNLPLRRGPLWYWKDIDLDGEDSASRLVARVELTRRLRRARGRIGFLEASVGAIAVWCGRMEREEVRRV